MMNSYEYSESEAPNLLFSYSSQSNYPSCPIPISTPIPPFNCGLNSSPEFPPVFGNEYMNENNNNNNIISDNACVVIDKSINNNEIDNTNTSNSNYNNNENHDNNYLYAKSHSFPFPLPLPLPLPSPYGIYNSSLPDHSTPVAESLLSGYVDDYPINNGIPSNINNNNNNNNNITCINTNINTSQMPNINNANDDNDDAVGDENNGHITLTLPSLENNINKNKNNNKGTNAADDAYSQCDISTNNNNNKLISNNNNYAHSQLQSPPLLSSILPQTPIDCPVTRVRMSQEEIDYYLSQQMHTETPPTPDLLHNNTNTNTHRSPKHKSRVHPLQKSSFFVQDIDSDLSENNYTYDNNMNDPIHLYQCNSPNYYNNYNYNPWTHFSHTPQSPQMPTLTPQTPPIPQIPSLNTSIKTEIKMELDSHDNSNSSNAPIPIKSDIIIDNDNDNDSDSDYDIMADRAKLKSIIKKSKSITATKSRKKRRGRKRKLSSCTKKPKKQLKKEKIKKRTRTNDSSSPTPRPHKKQKISHRHTTPTCDVEQYVAETMSKKEANAIFKQYIQNGECIISNGDKDGYWCKVNKCNKRFGSKCHLKRHCDEQHIGRGYKCIYNKCNSIFKQRVQGKEHVKNIHFGDNRQWICYLCGDDFTRWWGVRRHLELNRCDIINNKKYKSTYSTVQIAKIIKDAQDGKSRNKCRVNKFHKC